MKVFNSFRLLTKTTLFYLIIVFIAFFIGAHYLILKANNYVKDETESMFEKREWHLTRYLSDHDTIKDFRTTKISLLENISDTLLYPQYSDTVIYIEEINENQLHRKKILVIKAQDKFFLVNMLINIDSFNKFRIDVANRIVPAFVILAIVIIFLNILMSGFLLNPFHKILDKMNKYKIGKGVEISDVKTSTLEFKKMQLLFRRMINRTENDYQKLKEYTENMAHEIQTPLAIIRSKTEQLISDELVMNEHESSVKSIYNETNHLSRLGTTLNLLTKIENGEYTNKEELFTKSIILEHIESIKELADLKSLEIDLKLNELHQLNIDPFLFDIILKNLLRNALRYASGNGPISIVTTQKSIVISNYGEQLEGNGAKIFERFYTSDNSNQSLGLGLALVKRICDINNLHIEYNYTEGQHIFEIQNPN